jgi:hypothetical protein
VRPQIGADTLTCVPAAMLLGERIHPQDSAVLNGAPSICLQLQDIDVIAALVLVLVLATTPQRSVTYGYLLAVARKLKPCVR